MRHGDDAIIPILSHLGATDSQGTVPEFIAARKNRQMADKKALLGGVTKYETDAAGENITIKLEMAPGDQSLSLTIPYHRIWSFMLAIRDAAFLASQRQQQVPSSQMAVSAPFVATSLQVGHYPSTGRIALHLQTNEGLPLQIAMDRELAETTILHLQSALAISPDESKKLS
jgi:hypothetical protein